MTLRRALGVAALLVALAALWLGAALRPAAADHPLDQSLGVAMTDYGNDPSVLVDQLTRLQTHWWFEFVWSGAGDPPGFTKVELLRPCYARDASLMCTSPGPSVAEVQARAQQKPGRYWMLGNEPNTVDQDNLSPSAYATFLYTYGTAIKQVDPTAMIVG
ncbi:MAG: hypothetical protein HY691_15280, partial [Chloroflexi bacterium]|nr:hypothetical protein [Chloroflexota bacterium]